MDIFIGLVSKEGSSLGKESWRGGSFTAVFNTFSPVYNLGFDSGIGVRLGWGREEKEIRKRIFPNIKRWQMENIGKLKFSTCLVNIMTFKSLLNPYTVLVGGIMYPGLIRQKWVTK